METGDDSAHYETMVAVEGSLIGRTVRAPIHAARKVRGIYRVSRPHGKSALPDIPPYDEGKHGMRIVVSGEHPEDVFLSPERIPMTVDRSRTPLLNTSYVFGKTVTAGAGHLRPEIAAFKALNGGNAAIHCVRTIADRAHGFGSLNGFGKRMTEFAQRHINLQNIVLAPLIHQLNLINDIEATLATVDHAVADCPLDAERIIAFMTNPDPAYIFAYLQRHLEERYGKPIVSVLALTDHFPTNPQLIWNLIDVDLILVPDEQTRAQTVKQLLYWQKKMRKVRGDRKDHIPELVVCPFIQDMAFAQPLSEHLLRDRRAQYSENMDGIVDILIQLGGSGPGKEYLAEVARFLKTYLPNVQYTTILRDGVSSAVTAYKANMETLGAEVHATKSHYELVETMRSVYESGRLPAFLFVKPGELSNFLRFFPEQLGGSIFLCAPPVGDQERENIRFFQSEEGGYVLPSDKENAELLSILLRLSDSNASQQQAHEALGKFSEKLHCWRGVILPGDPANAAMMIAAAKKYGVFKMMGEKTIVYPSYAMRPDGATKAWYHVEAFLERKAEREELLH